jgi:LysM repeat protein
MKKILVLSYFLFLGSSILFGNQLHEAYISKWKSIAIQHMLRYKIPASITLAQGILESGYGESDLAQKANNHFGIKCGNGWNGETSYKNDDTDNECFRKYSNVEESYDDHALFLKNKDRYAKLFTLDVKNYRGWANGLKEAGYATHPKYAQKLIDLIELHKLNELDQNMEDADMAALVEDLSTVKSIKANKNQEKSVVLNSLLANTHSVILHANKVKYVIAKKGDTFYRIAEEFNMGMWQLYKYNDFGDKKDMLEPGDIVYLQPKKRKAKRNSKTEITISKSEDLRTISQQEGIRLQSLMNLNPELKDVELRLKKGTKIVLR